MQLIPDPSGNMLGCVTERANRPSAAAYAALAVTDTLLAGLGPRAHRWRRLTKPLLMPVLAASLARRTTRDDPTTRLTLAAQAMSWAGDVALMEPGRTRLLTGVGSFFGAHLAYVAAFRTRGAVGLLTTPRSQAVLAAGSLIAFGNAVQAGRRDPALRLPIATYGSALGAMAASAALLPEGVGNRRIQAGAALFLLSDSLLGLQMFLRHEPSPALEAAVMATYTSGQWLISEGVRSASSTGVGVTA